MECFIGIDLGSTTTKAIVVDEDGRILGRGITNSRSNYDVAAKVAREEAYTNVRFSALSQRLRENNALGDQLEAFEIDLGRSFALEGYLGQLARLEECCQRDVFRHAAKGGDTAAISEAITDIIASMRKHAVNMFMGEEEARSDFFRDIAGSDYTEYAAAIARSGGPAFDRLLGVYDRNIIPVENEIDPRSFSQRMTAAFKRIAPLYRGEHDRLAQRIQEVIDEPIDDIRTVGTGYGRARLPFPKEQIRSEILCHGLGAHLMFPATRTVLDIGGQDTKAIQIDEQGVVTSFQMNDRCAAGCGRYLGYIADEMNIGLHELAPLAMKSTCRVKINSTCTVFAGAEFRDRLAAGQHREDILAGLHRAIILRAISLLARSGGIRNEFTFTG
ncbi:MAG: acyl-CoA dehydratase activase, partial [Planctomycetes bacterium]|nr:acyl-CoA dehydratase activase [Planctomycetota bacterium]